MDPRTRRLLEEPDRSDAVAACLAEPRPHHGAGLGRPELMIDLDQIASGDIELDEFMSTAGRWLGGLKCW